KVVDVALQGPLSGIGVFAAESPCMLNSFLPKRVNPGLVFLRLPAANPIVFLPILTEVPHSLDGPFDPRLTPSADLCDLLPRRNPQVVENQNQPISYAQLRHQLFVQN